ncbi:MAG: transporter associated domain-containing protein [Verrucomicrobiota bacterium]
MLILSKWLFLLLALVAGLLAAACVGLASAAVSRLSESQGMPDEDRQALISLHRHAHWQRVAFLGIALMAFALFLLLGTSGRFPLLGAASLAVFFLLIDTLPRILGHRHQERALARGPAFSQGIARRLAPLGKRLESLRQWAIRLPVLGRLQEKVAMEQKEFEAYLEREEDQGTLREGETDLILEVLKLNQRTARDFMAPRVEVFTLADDLTSEEVRELVRHRPYNYIPVHHDTRDQIVGVLDVHNFLLKPPYDFAKHTMPPVFVPETLGALPLLCQYLPLPRSLVIVLDEHGGFEGVVTQTDLTSGILSEFLELPEDYDPDLQEIAPGRLLAKGTASIDALRRMTEIELPLTEARSLGGWMTSHLGHFPERGQSIEEAGLRLTVRKATADRVVEVLVEQLSPSVLSRP